MKSVFSMTIHPDASIADKLVLSAFLRGWFMVYGMDSSICYPIVNFGDSRIYGACFELPVYSRDEGKKISLARRLYAECERQGMRYARV